MTTDTPQTSGPQTAARRHATPRPFSNENREAGIARELERAIAENVRLRAWIEAIGNLPDVDADNRGWMARDALAGKEFNGVR